ERLAVHLDDPDQVRAGFDPAAIAAQVGAQIGDAGPAPCIELALDAAVVLEPQRNRREIEHLGIVIRSRAVVVSVLHEMSLSKLSLPSSNSRRVTQREVF